jgi:hypothetical protein
MPPDRGFKLPPLPDLRSLQLPDLRRLPDVRSMRRNEQLALAAAAGAAATGAGLLWHSCSSAAVLLRVSSLLRQVRNHAGMYNEHATSRILCYWTHSLVGGLSASVASDAGSTGAPVTPCCTLGWVCVRQCCVQTYSCQCHQTS